MVSINMIIEGRKNQRIGCFRMKWETRLCQELQDGSVRPLAPMTRCPYSDKSRQHNRIEILDFRLVQERIGTARDGIIAHWQEMNGRRKEQLDQKTKTR